MVTKVNPKYEVINEYCVMIDHKFIFAILKHSRDYNVLGRIEGEFLRLEI